VHDHVPSLELVLLIPIQMHWAGSLRRRTCGPQLEASGASLYNVVKRFSSTIKAPRMVRGSQTVDTPRQPVEIVNLSMWRRESTL
jgi:hypothetical protein